MFVNNLTALEIRSPKWVSWGSNNILKLRETSRFQYQLSCPQGSQVASNECPPKTTAESLLLSTPTIRTLFPEITSVCTSCCAKCQSSIWSVQSQGYHVTVLQPLPTGLVSYPVAFFYLQANNGRLNLSPAPYLSEKAMAPHSSTLAWKIPWMEEPGGLQSMGSQRVRHD